MNKAQERRVACLQSNLFSIRQIIGWTAADLGDLLDVSRQTIYNLERGKLDMSLVQYLAITKVVEDEIQQQPENELLKEVYPLLIYGDQLPKEDYKVLQAQLTALAPGMSKKATRSLNMMTALQLIGPVAASLAGIAAGLVTKNPGLGIQTASMGIRALGKHGK